MKSYDVIVVGAGNGGLVAAKGLNNAGYKVLLLDEHNNVGGLSRNIKKGRFEFIPSFHCLFTNGDYFNINKLFKDIGVKESIEFKDINSEFKIFTKDNAYTLPLGIDNFIDSLVGYVPDSKESLIKFFELAEECSEALEYLINKGNDYEFIKENYENFIKLSNMSLSKVLDIINMPLKAQEIINSFWIYLGSPETEISFVHYSSLLFRMLKNGIMIPSKGSYEIGQAILNSYLENGGEVKYNSKVVNLIIEDNKCKGVKLLDGTCYLAKNIIVNSDIKSIYEKLVLPEELPLNAVKNINQREIGPKVFTVCLGLNRTCEELGLNNFNYFVYNSLDSDAVFKEMKTINNSNMIACNFSNVLEMSSIGTSVLSLSTLFVDDCFNNSVDDSNYEDIVNNVVNNLLDNFEKSTSIMIREFIEEIEVLTPVSIASYASNSLSSSYGFKLTGLDNLVPRILNKSDECYVEGLVDCGGFDGDLFDEISAYRSGFEAYLKVCEKNSGELNE